jgi:hypothetical protein
MFPPLRLVIVLLLIAVMSGSVGCGGCDDTGGQTVEPPDAGLPDVDDANADDTGGEPDVQGPPADVGPGVGEPCEEEGAMRPCGSDVGECVPGSQYCVNGVWTECIGALGPRPESCNGRDDSCSGTPDDGPDLCPPTPCSGAGQCVEGQCVYDASTALDCSHLDSPCMVGLCVDKDEGECIQVPREDGTACDDGDLCTADEGVCFFGQCVADVKDCSQAGDQCNEGVCDPQTGACVPRPINDGTTCDDGRFCTTDTTCQAGQCVGQARSCAEYVDQCNDAACSDTLGCYALPLTGNSCSDGLYCTTNDICQAGVCVGGPTRDCSGLDSQCTVGTCNETTQSCAVASRPDGTVCNDGRFCTTATACAAGACTQVLSLRDCSDFNDSCHVGQCNLTTDRCDRIQTVFPCLTVTITGAPEARTWSTEALFEFECSDPVCEFECRVDGSAWMPCDSPEEYIGFSLGTHTFEVRARKNGSQWTDPARHSWEVYLPSCQDAAAARLYVGCEYWPVALHNAVDSGFHEHYAVVITNPLPGTTANIRVFAAGSATPIAQTQVPGNELRVLRLPWNAMAAIVGLPGGGTASRTQQGTIAYRLTSDIPVNVYQFNPLLSYDRRRCTGNGDCPGSERCMADGRCQTTGDYSYTNDASLLLPTHTFGITSQYMVPALPHMQLGGVDYPSYMAIVATQDNTRVRIRNRGFTATGPTFAAMDPGTEVTVTLNRHEVLQVATRAGGTRRQATAVPSNYGTAYEFPDSDLTGSIVSADKPIGLYSGASCRMMPFNYLACDHLEQQIFPLETLGHSYVGAVARPAPGVNTATAPVKGDVWRLVAVQNSTRLTFTPASVHPSVTLNAGDWVEFTSDRHFLVESQGPTHPILLSQYLTSQRAHGGTQGDPSMILPAPVTQYRQQSIFTTPSEIATHYVNIVRQAGTSVNLDGQPVPAACWQAIAGTNFEVCQRAISEGVHTVSAANGVGLTVYGYDSYVSYGYTGGLGLLPTTAINPDW